MRRFITAGASAVLALALIGCSDKGREPLNIPTEPDPAAEEEFVLDFLESTPEWDEACSQFGDLTAGLTDSEVEVFRDYSIDAFEEGYDEELSTEGRDKFWSMMLECR